MSQQPPASSVSVLVVEPRTGWQLIDFAELRQYRDLFYFLVWRDIKVLYKQTVLGFAWAILRPLFTMLIFSLVFGGLAGVPSDGVPYPIFSYAALLPWTYFSGAMTNSANSLVASRSMFTKIYFPRLIIPMVPVLAGLVDFAVASTLLAGLMIWYGIAPTGNIVFLPLLILLMILTSVGVGMWLSVLAIRFRDIKHGIPFLTQLLMYVAPVVWPVSLLAEKLPYDNIVRLVYGLYPMAGVIEGFRSALLGTSPMPWDMIAVGSVSEILFSLSAAFYFRRHERVFADVA